MTDYINSCDEVVIYMKIDMLEVKKDRLKEVRAQLKKKYLTGDYLDEQSKQLRIERESLKEEIKDIESRRNKR